MKSKKYFIFMLSILFLGTTSIALADKGGLKVAYADISRIFNEYYKTLEYNTVLEEKQGQFEKERNAKIQKLQDAQNKLNLLKEGKRAEIEQEIEKIKKEITDFDRQVAAELTKENNDKTREYLLEIEKVTSDFAQKQKYDVILNDRVLVYGDKGLDVTEQILKTLNESKPKQK